MTDNKLTFDILFKDKQMLTPEEILERTKLVQEAYREHKENIFIKYQEAKRYYEVKKFFDILY